MTLFNKNKLFIAFIVLSTLGISNAANAQQLKVPAPSSAQTIKQAFALSEIVIDYSRPSVKDRVIFGDVVPFGKVWRTGANASTKITFGEDVKVAGMDVKAGTYALYTIPNADVWDIMLYKDLTLGGDVADYKAENDVIRFKAKPTSTNTKIETFTITVADVTATSANIVLGWDKTTVAFSVSAEIDARIMKTIESTIIKDSRPYYSAATYYYDNNKDLKVALEWVDKAIANNPKAYWVVLLKAKIQLKLNDKKNATLTANQVIALATEDKNADYVKMAEKLIADAKK